MCARLAPAASCRAARCTQPPLLSASFLSCQRMLQIRGVTAVGPADADVMSFMCCAALRRTAATAKLRLLLHAGSG